MQEAVETLCRILALLQGVRVGMSGAGGMLGVISAGSGVAVIGGRGHAGAELCYTQLTMKVYLDACCLNRPFDDQGQPRVHLETEAISLILEKLHWREWDWVGSEMLLYEIRQNPDLECRPRVLLFASQAKQVIETSDKILRRAEELEKSGFDTYDAIHLASAEQARVDVFLTTDDQILKVASRNKKLLPFLVENPVKWLEEVLK